MIKKTFITLSIILLLSNCTTRSTKFTAISTDNVRGIEYNSDNRDEVINVSEKSCSHRIYLTRVAAGFLTFFGFFMPQFDLVLGSSENDRMHDSVNKALKTAKSSGVSDADLLTNVTLKEKVIILPLIYGYKCSVTEGDAVSSVAKS